MGMPRGASATASRKAISMLAGNPNYDAEISCIPTVVSDDHEPKYQPTTSGEYLRNRFVATQNS